MNLTQGEPVKYEQVIALMTDDFERWLKQKNEIKTSLVEIFPGMQVAFVIRKLPTYTENGREIQDSYVAFYNGQEQRVERKTGNIMFTVELLKEGGGEAKLAGRVELNIGGKLDYGWVGNVEKEIYQGLNNKLIFNSRNCVKNTQYGYSYSYKAFATGLFLYNPEPKVALKLKFDLYNPGSGLVRTLEVPRSLGSETTLSSLTKAIMKDVSTADLTILADSGSKLKVHKSFICARFVNKYISFYQAWIIFCFISGLLLFVP